MTVGPKDPIDLHAAVQRVLGRLSFVAGIQLTDVSTRVCNSLGEGTSADYSQGVCIGPTVGIFLDYWGWMRPHKRYSMAVFEKLHREAWQHVCSRIESVEEVVAQAVSTLAQHSLKLPPLPEAPDRKSS